MVKALDSVRESSTGYGSKDNLLLLITIGFRYETKAGLSLIAK